jgi:hypothetical protein
MIDFQNMKLRGLDDRDPAPDMYRNIKLKEFCPRCGSVVIESKHRTMCFDELIEGFYDRHR